MAHLTNAQLVQLKSELSNDPTSQGYAPLMAASDFAGVADKLNARVQSAGTVAREPMDTADLIESIDSGNFNSLSTANSTKLGILLSTAQVRIASNSVQALFAALFGANSATMAAFTALKTRVASRAEVLFGQGTLLESSDVELSRNV